MALVMGHLCVVYNYMNNEVKWTLPRQRLSWTSCEAMHVLSEAFVTSMVGECLILMMCGFRQMSNVRYLIMGPV